MTRETVMKCSSVFLYSAVFCGSERFRCDEPYDIFDNSKSVKTVTNGGLFCLPMIIILFFMNAISLTNNHLFMEV